MKWPKHLNKVKKNSKLACFLETFSGNHTQPSSPEKPGMFMNNGEVKENEVVHSVRANDVGDGNSVMPKAKSTVEEVIVDDSGEDAGEDSNGEDNIQEYQSQNA